MKSVVVRVTLPKSSPLPPAEKKRKEDVEAASKGLIGRHPLASFYALTFLLSWGYWVPDAISGGRWSHAPGLLGPMVAALVVTGITRGPAGLRCMIMRMSRWRVAVKWYLWMLVPLLLALVTAGFVALGDGEFPPFDEWTEINGFASITGWAGLGLILIVNCFGEETGWRGFALPAFRRRHHELTASLLVAAPWALWHLPTFFIDSGYQDFPIVFLPGWLLGFFALAVVTTWIYEGARSSILIIALLHLSLNIGSTSQAAQGLVSAVVTASVIIWSIVIAAHWRRRDRYRDRQAATIPDQSPESVHTGFDASARGWLSAAGSRPL
jgi:membrane protease YdiL (CAAX protease family)